MALRLMGLSEKPQTCAYDGRGSLTETRVAGSLARQGASAAAARCVSKAGGNLSEPRAQAIGVGHLSAGCQGEFAMMEIGA
jgi:hypothetical protein